jgi:hypothetical protein
LPELSHAECPLHVPHIPPQPSLPHSFPAQLGLQVASHLPLLHEPPPGQGPLWQKPPAPSGSPQSLPEQLGCGVPHLPLTHFSFGLQVPQEWPQPSSPQTRAPQIGIAGHAMQLPVFGSQLSLALHWPQAPPQPSGPQVFPEHDGVHDLHDPLTHFSPALQLVPHLPQFCGSVARFAQVPEQHEPLVQAGSHFLGGGRSAPFTSRFTSGLPSPTVGPSGRASVFCFTQSSFTQVSPVLHVLFW